MYSIDTYIYVASASSMPMITDAALRHLVTDPEDVPRLGQRFVIWPVSYVLAFHVGQT